MDRRITALTAACALAMTLGACASAEPEAGPAPTVTVTHTVTQTVTAEPEPEEPEPVATSTLTDEPVDETNDEGPSEPTVGPVVFGVPYVFESGLEVIVTSKGRRTVSDPYAVDWKVGDPYSLFDITIVNNTGSIFDAGLALSAAVYGPEGIAADQVFEGDMEPFFQGQILDGKRQTLTVGYAIPDNDLDDVVVTVTPEFDHDDAIFFGSLK